MSRQIQVLEQKIKQLNTYLELFKKTIDKEEQLPLTPANLNQAMQNKQNQKMNSKLQKAVSNINELSGEIKKKLQSNKFAPGDKLKVQKYKKDFATKMQKYTEMLRNYQERKTSELSSLRQTYIYRRSTYVQQQQRRASVDDQQSEQDHPQIELQEVNQETLFYEHMIQLKQKELLQVKEKMEEALKAQKEVGRLVNEQGEKLDIIEENVDTARSNVREAGTLLEEGVQHHMSAQKKKMLIIGIIFVVLLIIIIPILVTQL